MKIAVIVDTWFPFIGGGQINAWEISKKLAKKGLEIEIVTRNCGKDTLPRVKNLTVTKFGSASSPSNQIAKIIFLFQSFIYILRKDHDLVHAHAFLPGLIGRMIMITKGIPAVFTVHGTSINTNLNNYFSKQIEKFILTKILYSKQMTVSQDFLEINNVNKNIIYVPNGFELTNVKSLKKKKSKVQTLIFVGRLHPQKNIPNLLMAIKIVEKEFKIKLLIVGNGLLKKEITELIKTLKLQKTVKLEGEVDKVTLSRLYRRSDLFILPSIYEGQPLTLLEAWASKLPVIVSNTGDCKYIVKENQNGFLISNPHDHKDIALVIKKALKNKNLNRLGQNGYNLVKNKYSWEKSADLTQKVYESFKTSKN